MTTGLTARPAPRSRAARRLIASYIEPAKQDNGPRTPDHPTDTFAEEFLELYARHWKPKTLTASTYVVRNHILSAFGRMPLDRIGPEDVAAWFDADSGDRPARPTTRSRYCVR